MNDKNAARDGSGQDTSMMLKDLMAHGQRAWSLLMDKRVPGSHKLIPAAALAYVISPIDLLPEMAFLGIGYLDDFAILLLALRWFNRLAGDHVAAMERDMDDAIDADYRVAEPGSEGVEPIV